MKFILKKYLSTLVSVFLVTQIVPALTIKNNWTGLLYASFILGLLFHVIRPLINAILLPINLLTLNLSSWIMQVILFYLWTLVVGETKIAGWHFGGFSFGPIVLSSFDLVKWQVILVIAVLFIFIANFFDWLLK